VITISYEGNPGETAHNDEVVCDMYAKSNSYPTPADQGLMRWFIPVHPEAPKRW